MDINVSKLSIATEAIFNKNDAKKIRGYLGNIFFNHPYAHNHKPDGSLIYQYPRVQYKVIDGNCILIGFFEGSEIVIKTFHDLKEINMNGRWHEILSKGLETYNASFSITSHHLTYTFISPWLALNSENYQKYQTTGSIDKKKALLKKILIGNIISISKSIGYTVSSLIEAKLHYFKEVNISLKGTTMLGFLGTFSINFEIPDYWGIGKSVSRGFGTIKKIENVIK